MSKEAAAAGGTVGTLPYFKALNEDLLLAPFMRDVSGWRYYEALEALAGRCRETIDVLCEDLKAHARIIRYVPARNRMNALNLVETLSGGAALVSPFCGDADECAAILSLSASETGTKSRAGDADVDRAEALLSSGFGPLSGFQRESLVQETLRWGVSSAAGADETKQNFLAELCGAGGLDFLEDVWNKHLYQTSPDSFSGAGGYAVCSEAHIDYLWRKAVGSSVSLTRYGGSSFAAAVREGLRGVAEGMARDLEEAAREGDYLTDQSAANLRAAADELSRCGVFLPFSLGYQIERLKWYTPLEQGKVLALQEALGRLGFGNLVQDGVYGPKTSEARSRFLDFLANESLPKLQAIELSQDVTSAINKASLVTGMALEFGPTVAQEASSVRLYRADIFFGTTNVLLTEPVYNVLNKMGGDIGTVSIGSRIFLTAGVTLSALELMKTMQDDLNDADKKLGRPTVSKVLGIGGRWMGGLLGAKYGALALASAGMFLGATGVGVVVLGFVGAFMGSEFGASLGEALMEQFVDITDVDR